MAPWTEWRTSNTPSACSSAGATTCRQVWDWNLDVEFAAFIAAVTGVDKSATVIAIDMEFPGFLHEVSQSCAWEARYQALREDVNRLWPIQLGVAVAGLDGEARGVWSFNLHFDTRRDLHTVSSVEFLKAAGVDFARHRSEGIDPAVFGRMLATSGLFGENGIRPAWLTFAGAYDFAYLLKLLTCGSPLPGEPMSFQRKLASLCPRRHELRDQLPRGSLDSLSRKLGVQRRGAAHTAGSDALLTLELFLYITGIEVNTKEAAGPLWFHNIADHTEDADGFWKPWGAWAGGMDANWASFELSSLSAIPPLEEAPALEHIWGYTTPWTSAQIPLSLAWHPATSNASALGLVAPSPVSSEWAGAR